jgi:hypothetical protein
MSKRKGNAEPAAEPHQLPDGSWIGCRHYFPGTPSRQGRSMGKARVILADEPHEHESDHREGETNEQHRNQALPRAD